jgi:hypothetical protein
VLLRRLIGPLVLYDESTRPDYVNADAVVKTGLIDGLAEYKMWRPQPDSNLVDHAFCETFRAF